VIFGFFCFLFSIFNYLNDFSKKCRITAVVRSMKIIENSSNHFMSSHIHCTHLWFQPLCFLKFNILVYVIQKVIVFVLWLPFKVFKMILAWNCTWWQMNNKLTNKRANLYAVDLGMELHLVWRSFVLDPDTILETAPDHALVRFHHFIEVHLQMENDELRFIYWQSFIIINWRKGSPQETRPEWENSSLGFIEAVHQW